jgi:cilia- and flagella-associated protein 251
LPSGFSVSTFVPTTSTVITGTSEGDLLIWADKSLNNLSQNLPKGQKAAIKFVKAHNSAITFVTTVNDKYVVTGGEDGYIKIFDFHLRLVFWIERIKAGAITSISFGNPMKYEGEQTGCMLHFLKSFLIFNS